MSEQTLASSLFELITDTVSFSFLKYSRVSRLKVDKSYVTRKDTEFRRITNLDSKTHKIRNKL